MKKITGIITMLGLLILATGFAVFVVSIDAPKPILYNESYISTHQGDTSKDRRIEFYTHNFDIKCYGITHELGNGFFDGFFGGVYPEGELVVETITGWDTVNTKVTYRGTIVLKFTDDCMGLIYIDNYRPDIADWITQINKIYAEHVKPARTAKNLEKWGIH